MSIAEMKKEIKDKIENIDDELLIRKVMDLIDNPQPRPTIDEVYADIVKQYGNTLKKLAQ